MVLPGLDYGVRILCIIQLSDLSYLSPPLGAANIRCTSCPTIPQSVHTRRVRRLCGMLCLRTFQTDIQALEKAVDVTIPEVSRLRNIISFEHCLKHLMTQSRAAL